VTQTVRVIEEGKDVTAKEVKKEKGRKPDSGNQCLGNPFDPEVQGRLALAPMDQTRSIGGKECAGYQFEVRNTKVPSTRGIAWVEKATGIPREIQDMRLDPLPDKHLKDLAVSMVYEAGANGWHVKEMRTVGYVKVLFVNAEFHSTVSFSEYWKVPRSEETAEALH
jgi:hypothetical protein